MIETKNLQKTFKNGDVETHVLKGIDFRAEEGEFIAIMGRSGAGKSTFLYQMSLLDDPVGERLLSMAMIRTICRRIKKCVFRLSEVWLCVSGLRALPELTALENVALPLLMQGHLKAQGVSRGTSGSRARGARIIAYIIYPPSSPAENNSASP